MYICHPCIILCITHAIIMVSMQCAPVQMGISEVHLVMKTDCTITQIWTTILGERILQLKKENKCVYKVKLKLITMSLYITKTISQNRLHVFLFSSYRTKERVLLYGKICLLQIE